MAVAMTDPYRPPLARETKPLRYGGMLRCPWCEHTDAEWKFDAPQPNPAYRAQLPRLCRCPACRRFFPEPRS